MVSTFEELKSVDHAALLCCQSSENLSFIPRNSVDAIITDPPYFDNVQYSELADFFYVWLRLGLQDTYPWFRPELSSRSSEIVKNDKLGKTVDFFSEGLCRVFTECHRVLKDDGLLIFTFHHNRLWAWEEIARLLLNAGFYISASPVVRSEGKSGFHSSKGNIRYDCVLVCRKRPSHWKEELDWFSLKERILEDAILWTRRTLNSDMLVSEVDIFTIVMGKTIEYYTKVVADETRRSALNPLPELLREMQDLVAHVGVQAEPAQILPRYAEQVEQLSLFVMESKAKYGHMSRE